MPRPWATSRLYSGSDVPFVPAEPQRPGSRLGRMQALDAALSAARAGADDRAHAALRGFIDAGRPLRFRAERAVDISQALEAAKALGLPAYLSGVQEGHRVLEALQGSDLGVVLEIDDRLSNLGSDTVDEVDPLREDPDCFSKLRRAGLRVAIDAKGGDLLLAAAMAHDGGPGLAALRAVTLEAARLLGVDDRCGSLAAGKDADFAVVNGHPLSSQSHVLETWVGGERVWKRVRDAEDQTDAVVLRAGRVYDGLGGVHEDAEVLIVDGVVVECGPRVAHPKYARVIDAGPDAVITPGFVDAHGHVGYGSDNTAVDAQVETYRAFVVARADARALAKAGVTTVLAAPRNVGGSGARVVAVKTAGESAEELVSDRLAAMKINTPNGPTGAGGMVNSLLQRAKKYDKSWKDYETALAKWKAEQAKAKDAPAKAASSAKAAPAAPSKDDGKKKEAAASDPVTGTWEGKIDLSSAPIPAPDGGTEASITLMLRLQGKKVTGSVKADLGDETLAAEGTLDGKKLRLEMAMPEGPIPIPDAKILIDATLDGPDHMAGTLSIAGMIEAKLEATRTEKGAPTIKVGRRKTAKAAADEGPEEAEDGSEAGALAPGPRRRGRRRGSSHRPRRSEEDRGDLRRREDRGCDPRGQRSRQGGG